MLKFLVSDPVLGGENFPCLPRRCHSFMSDPVLGGEVMSCLITNSCSCLIQSLAATVDSMTLPKFLVSDPVLGGENFPCLPRRCHSFMSDPVLGGEIMSQRVSKLFLGGYQPLKVESEAYIYTTIFKN